MCYVWSAVIELVDEFDEIRVLRFTETAPAQVIADLYVLHEKCNIDYKGSFVANLIAYSALHKFLKARGEDIYEWDDYAVMSKIDYHNVAYIYTVKLNGAITLTVKEWMTEEGWKVIFEGTLEEAYEKFCRGTRYENGVHVNRQLFSIKSEE